MPAKKDRCVRKVMKQWHKKRSAYAICTSKMKKKKAK